MTTAAPGSTVALLGEEALRERVERLAAIPDRGSATPGEREAADYIAADLRDAGARSVTIETAPAHGTYWWPIGIPVAAATLGGLIGGRPGAVLGALATLSNVDDIKIGPRVLRRLLPKRETTNVIAEFGDPTADRTLLVTAHHDAAHSGLVFHPDLLRALPRRFEAMRRYDYTPPSMWTSVAGPALVTIGSATGSRALRRLGTVLAAGNVAAMVDIGLRPVVPGANDNATGVAVLQSLARRLASEPPDGLRVILVSAGSEESFMEGMAAFAQRHYPELPRERTKVITLDTVGSPKLALLRGEGMLGVRDYSPAMHALMTSCADALGLDVFRDLRFRNATDGLIAMNAGFDTAVVASADEFKIGTGYHWPTDTADRIDYGTVADAARLCALAIERIAAGEPG